MVKTQFTRETIERKAWSFKLLAWQTKKWADGSSPVCLVVRRNNERKVFSLNISAFPDQWNKGFERYEIAKGKKGLHPNRREYNHRLDAMADRCRQVIWKLEQHSPYWTVDQFEQEFLEKPKTSKVIEYYHQHIDRLKSLGQYGSARTFETAFKVLASIDKKFDERDFREINYDYVVRTVNHLKTARKMQNNTISIYMRCLRTLLNEAIKDDVGCMETYPFSNKFGARRVFSISRTLKQKTRKRYLPMKYLRMINEAVVTQPHLIYTKHVFLFSFFAGGINFKDIALLRTSSLISSFNKDGEPVKVITYSRAKTQEDIEVTINSDIQRQIDALLTLAEPVDDYLLPLISVPGLEGEKLDNHLVDRRRRFNRYLKDLVRSIGFPEEIVKISSYFARHSYAMTLLKKGNSIDLISEALHHSDTKTTKIYLESFGRDEIARISEGLLD